MKKICLILCFAIVVSCLAGCGGTESAESASASPYVEAALEEEAAEAAAEPFALDKQVKVKMLLFSVNSDWREVDKERRTLYYKTDRNADGMFYASEKYASSSESPDGDIAYLEEEVDAYYDAYYDETEMTDFSRGELMEIDGMPAIQVSYSETINEAKYNNSEILLKFKNRIYHLGVIEPAESDGSLLATMPDIIASIKKYVAPPDLLIEVDTRRQIEKFIVNFDFEGIIELCESYIAEESPAEGDSVFAILEQAEAANAIMANCQLVVDEFEGKARLYGSVTEIKSGVCFVPYFVGSGSSLSNPFSFSTSKHVIVGFQKNSWLFFDELKIKIADETYIKTSFAYNRVTRDVLSGGAIVEYVDWYVDEEEIEGILNAEGPIIRFVGESGKTFDHTITERELQSLENLQMIEAARYAIDGIISDWKSFNT